MTSRTRQEHALYFTITKYTLFHSLTALTKKDDWKEIVLAKGTVSSWS